MNRRQAVLAFFGLTIPARYQYPVGTKRFIRRTYAGPYPCPKWLERLLLDKHPKQIKETLRYGGSAKGIVERVLQGADSIDGLVELAKPAPCDNSYVIGLYNGLLMAQAMLQDEDYEPLQG